MSPAPPSSDDLLVFGCFTCPLCGSHAFGTTFDSSVPGVDLSSPIHLLIGYCKGQPIRDARGQRLACQYAPCDFKWSRRDDATYGLIKHGRPQS